MGDLSTPLVLITCPAQDSTHLDVHTPVVLAHRPKMPRTVLMMRIAQMKEASAFCYKGYDRRCIKDIIEKAHQLTQKDFPCRDLLFFPDFVGAESPHPLFDIKGRQPFKPRSLLLNDGTPLHGVPGQGFHFRCHVLSPLFRSYAEIVWQRT